MDETSDFEEGYMSTADVETSQEVKHHVYSDLMNAHFHREAILQHVKLFGGEVVDVGSDHITVGLTSWPRRIDAFIQMLKPFGMHCSTLC